MPYRTSLERAAASGRASAIAALQGPECPEALRYLRDLAIQLYGRSGVGMNGTLLLSYSTLADFMTVTDTLLTPWEAEVLLACDATIHAALNSNG